MRFSLFYNFDVHPEQVTTTLYQEVEAQAIAADISGFDAIWLAEHHFAAYGRMPSSLLYLAHLSGLTQHIELGTAVVEASLYNPLRLAEDVALLDELSGGRLRLGIGSGSARKSEEFAQFGVPLEEKTSRMLEIAETLRQAFDERRIDFQGRHYQYRDVSLQPQSRRAASQLLWLAANGSTARIAGQQGYGLLVPRVGQFEQHRQLITDYRQVLAGKRGHVSVLRFVFVAETLEEAQFQTNKAIARYAQFDCGITWDGRTDTREYQDILQRLNVILGTPEQVALQLQACQEQLSFEEIMCQVHAAGIEHEDALKSIQLLGREVIPSLQPTPPVRSQLEASAIKPKRQSLRPRQQQRLWA
ncbi:LLM class flavin-dependent oxidoreductase [Ktedonobacter robiniae]|uniref:Luciferase-like domain-containing protein n=1 Tax=Ktedonobacter robiniae TaxID=2778365 RepID=A0ABQ3V552_9CHLR|nr:LLM class flavin-dependent oxidoreductase [Ktedonobacter robiniae]GHO59590.1 hypothetical protein KSB_80650 [Ktedonobacter robiniae]